MGKDLPVDILSNTGLYLVLVLGQCDMLSENIWFVWSLSIKLLNIQRRKKWWWTDKQTDRISSCKEINMAGRRPNFHDQWAIAVECVNLHIWSYKSATKLLKTLVLIYDRSICCNQRLGFGQKGMALKQTANYCLCQRQSRIGIWMTYQLYCLFDLQPFNLSGCFNFCELINWYLPLEDTCEGQNWRAKPN